METSFHTTRIPGMGAEDSDRATSSLNNLLKEDKYPDIKYGIKFGYKNIGFNGKSYTFPYFLAFLLKRFIAEKNK